MEDQTKFLYKVDKYYNPQSERGIAFNDPELGINWIIDSDDLKLSKKDLILPFFSEAEYLKMKNNV